MPIEPVEKIWMDGALVPWADAKIHVLTHALHYGSGVFEGIRAYDTEQGAAVFRLDDHIRRLFRSAHVHHMEIPYSHDEIAEAITVTVRESGLRSCYIRPLVYRGYGEMGLNPLPAVVNVTVAVWPWGLYLGEDATEAGVRVKISSWKRSDHNILPPGAKATGQYINSSLAKVEALKGGYDEAIMLNYAGYVTDGSGENVFIAKDGVLFTPPVSAGCLDGITRDSIVTIARDLGYEVVERNLSRFDLYTADEAFFTGTAAEVAPIREVDDRALVAGGRGPLTKELQDAFDAAVHGRDDRYRSWLTPVGD
ncbi:MAG TPA: branched-chain amino acid transaminase [Actinomycetota bacterium]|nr:branched-chain amino acid transaminase [Actinomycetota bacterium]